MAVQIYKMLLHWYIPSIHPQFWECENSPRVFRSPVCTVKRNRLELLLCFAGLYWHRRI